MDILPVSSKIRIYLKRRNLEIKFDKQLKLLQNNITHPSLNVEILEPTSMQLYSFRVDRKYRAIFFFREAKKVIEVIKITDHYQ